PAPPPCPGLCIPWSVGPICTTYPFAIHDPLATTCVGFELRYCNMRRNVIYVASYDCAGVAYSSGIPCSRCSGLESKVQKVVEHAMKPAEKIRPHHECSVKQLLDTITHFEKKMNAERFKHRNTKLTLKRAQKCVAKYKAIISFVGKHQIPGLQRIFVTAFSNCWSNNKILKHCKLATEGKYHPKNYTQDDKDLAVYVYE
ncbi:hypothetical protein K435DRAFT_606493, partial [Dendrothele bispora CBS 962.96]